MVFSNVRPCVHIGQLLSLIQICLNCPIDSKLPFYGCCHSCFWLTLLYPQEVEKYLSLFLVCSCHCFNYVQNHSLMKLFIVHIQNDVILAYHWSIEMYTGLLLGIQSVHWPIIVHLYCMTSFFISTIKSFDLSKLNLNDINTIKFKYFPLETKFGHSRRYINMAYKSSFIRWLKNVDNLVIARLVGSNQQIQIIFQLF